MDINKHIEGLFSAESTVRRKSAYSIETLLDADGSLEFPPGTLGRMAEGLADPDHRFWLVYLLDVMAALKVDVSEAKGALEQVALLPRGEGFRDHAVVALENLGIKKGEYPESNPRLDAQEDWVLESVTHRPRYGDALADLATLPKSELLCPECTGDNTRTCRRVMNVSGTNESGAELIIKEIHCAECRLFSAWVKSDEWSTAD
jgi:hypothetical protein